ncbi:MAG: DHHA1 domain-containing protein [Planctomycetes bacterium]|jgi:oligoribonuclease NrnB/cAMP/cGMP phosphodiesterase (DHH superfamily)|nr:DHHA1 domain-containing protein [Planctomycetota bacterium]
MMPQPICYYHGDHDGAAAALVVAYRHGGIDQVRFRPVNYGQARFDVDCEGAQVWFVDYCPPRTAAALEVVNAAARTLIFDHHPAAAEYGHWLAEHAAPEACCEVEYEAELSGCELVLSCCQATILCHLVPRSTLEALALLCRYVGDRDLWRFELPHSRLVNAWLGSYASTPEAMQEALVFLRDRPWKVILEAGAAVQRALDVQVHRLARSAVTEWPWWDVRPLPFAGLPVVSCESPVLESEVGERLLQDHPEAAVSVTWSSSRPGRFRFSLRSRDDGPDVGELARQMGGGGHPHASGYHLELRGLLGFESAPMAAENASNQ